MKIKILMFLLGAVLLSSCAARFVEVENGGKTAKEYMEQFNAMDGVVKNIYYADTIRDIYIIGFGYGDVSKELLLYSNSNNLTVIEVKSANSLDHNYHFYYPYGSVSVSYDRYKFWTSGKGDHSLFLNGRKIHSSSD